MKNVESLFSEKRFLIADMDTCKVNIDDVSSSIIKKYKQNKTTNNINENYAQSEGLKKNKENSKQIQSSKSNENHSIKNSHDMKLKNLFEKDNKSKIV